MFKMTKYMRVGVVSAFASAMLVGAQFAGATGFDVTPLTTGAQNAWQSAIVVILGVLGLFLGAKVAIKWAMRLLAR